MRSEADVRAHLVRSLRTTEAHVQAIESEGTGNGIPDLYLNYKGIPAWIELKYAEIIRHEVRIKFRPGQRAWLEAEKKAGGIALLGIYVPADDATFFLHSNFKETYAYPMTEWNLRLEKLHGQTLLDWIERLR